MAKRRSVGTCDRCDAPLLFPPWPRIVFREEKPNEVVCPDCVLPSEVGHVGPPAMIEMVRCNNPRLVRRKRKNS